MFSRTSSRFAKLVNTPAQKNLNITVPLACRMSNLIDASPSPVVRPQFDYKWIRSNIESLRHSMETRNYVSVDIDNMVQLIDDRSNLLATVYSMRAYRNNIANRMKQLTSKNPSGEAPSKLGHIEGELDLGSATLEQLIGEGKRIKTDLVSIEARLTEVENTLERLAFKLPNTTHPSVPEGSEDKATLLHTQNPHKATLATFAAHGSIPKDHLEIAREYKLIDLESASKVTGSRFYYLTREAAMLELGLINYAVQKLVNKGFIPVLPPDMARLSVIEGAGFQSKDEKTLDHHIYTLNNTDMALCGTAEIPMAGRYMNEIIPEAELPIKTVAYNHCFRTEVGGMGQQTKGIYRVHQFSKVEMFVLCTPLQAEALHQEIVAIEQEIFNELGLHYRMLDMPTEDLGAPAYRKIDIEACMPGRAMSLHRAALANKLTQETKAKEPVNAHTLLQSVDEIRGLEDCYGEISSASNCTDYQARRLNIRYKPTEDPLQPVVEGPATKFVFTLNGTACAVPRMIVAILEQNQQPDGTVVIPEVLRPFMLGNTHIPFANRLW